MNILLLNPYYSQPKEYYSFYRPTAPFGLLYLAAYLRKFGIASRICELGIFEIEKAVITQTRVRFGLSDNAIEEIIRSEQPRIVGITCMYSIFYKDVLEIARLIKKIDPKITVVLGGNHSSSYWAHMLKDINVDFIVIGEGEATFLELSKKLLKNEDVSDVKGIAFRKSSSESVATPPREMVADLDSIPYPAYDLVDYKKYLGEGNPFAMRPPGAGIISSRGCPGTCVYCTVQAVWGRTWRARSPQNVLGEIVLVKERYGIREFAFLDDSASLDIKRWEALSDKMIAQNMDIKWSTPNGIAHWTLTESILDKMRAAGCYRITFGIESGNSETRKFIGKPYSLAQAKHLIQHANAIGLWTISTFILGFPYEKRKSMLDTLEFAKNSGTDIACFYLLIPQPNSEVYGIFKKEGLFNFDEANFEQINLVLNETGCDTVYFKKEELSLLQKKFYRSFMLHRGVSYIFQPWRLFKKMRSAEDVAYVFRLIGKALLIFMRTFNPLNKKSSDFIYVTTKQKLPPAGLRP